LLDWSNDRGILQIRFESYHLILKFKQIILPFPICGTFIEILKKHEKKIPNRIHLLVFQINSNCHNFINKIGIRARLKSKKLNSRKFSSTSNITKPVQLSKIVLYLTHWMVLKNFEVKIHLKSFEVGESNKVVRFKNTSQRKKGQISERCSTVSF